jgi:hypothetical protein
MHSLYSVIHRSIGVYIVVDGVSANGLRFTECLF